MSFKKFTVDRLSMDSNITLWQFLLELLVKDQHKHIISWTSNEGEFKLINAEEVAKLWGLRKNKHNMNYDKLSRALRYYYEKNIIKKVMGQKFVYRFVSFPEIVKTENKIPFKVKMESIAHEYGQRVMPHFASFNAQNIKTSAQNAKPTDLSTKSSSKTSHRPTRISSEEPRSKISKRDREVFTIKVDSPVPSPSTLSTASRSSAASPQPTISSPTSSTVSKPKPCPISLDSSLMSHLATSSSYLPIPISPAKISPFKFTALPTPLMVPSPMMGPRAPLLHFWSSLSPVTTMSPRFGPAFQFPGFFNGQIPFPPVTISSTSTMENLATPGVPSPTRTIQVP